MGITKSEIARTKILKAKEHQSQMRNATELSKHVWSLKEGKKNFNITWNILKLAKRYSNIYKKCNLCLTEKYYIMFKPDMSSLNKRVELFSSCRHSSKFLLSSL